MAGSRPSRRRSGVLRPRCARWQGPAGGDGGSERGGGRLVRNAPRHLGRVIRPALSRLVSDLGRVRLADGLATLADDLADPTADLVVSALILAARGEAQNLIDLLGSLAVAARDDADMRLRVDANRARIRTSVRVIAGVTITMVVALILFNGTYLKPFDSAGGQVVLAFVFAGFGGGLAWLNAMSRYQSPDRFLARRDTGQTR